MPGKTESNTERPRHAARNSSTISGTWLMHSQASSKKLLGNSLHPVWRELVKTILHGAWGSLPGPGRSPYCNLQQALWVDHRAIPYSIQSLLQETQTPLWFCSSKSKNIKAPCRSLGRHRDINEDCVPIQVNSTVPCNHNHATHVYKVEKDKCTWLSWSGPSMTSRPTHMQKLQPLRKRERDDKLSLGQEKPVLQKPDKLLLAQTLFPILRVQSFLPYLPGEGCWLTTDQVSLAGFLLIRSPNVLKWCRASFHQTLPFYLSTITGTLLHKCTNRGILSQLQPRLGSSYKETYGCSYQPPLSPQLLYTLPFHALQNSRCQVIYLYQHL